MKHLIHTPFTGRGEGKGNKWLKERIDIFVNFTLYSLLRQTNKNFIHWIGWREKDRNNEHVKRLRKYLKAVSRLTGYKFIFIFGGLAIWDDRKKREERDLPKRLKVILKQLTPQVRGVEYIYQTVLDSDDMYSKDVVSEIQSQPYRENGAFGYKNGYIKNYQTGEMAEWNPTTCPPFYTIMFPAKTFLDPIKHIEYIKAYKSHEYVEEVFNFEYLPGRKYAVGIHGNNIGTKWNHKFRGKIINANNLKT